jgi:4-amino-4-deoxy-L-arabinose transferase-like glycosyltransferase
MILLIPLAIWLASADCYLAFYKDLQQSFRRSLLTATTGLFFFIAVSTELLGAINAINSFAIAGAWAALDITLFLLFLRLRNFHHISLGSIAQNWITSTRHFVGQLGLLTTFILASILGFTLIVALVATPNNLDSLSYHLSRLGYWVQNGNVNHYASHIERSISFSPFSEYVHLHTFLLSGSERYFQLLQWLCFAGSLAIISLLVETFAGSRVAMQVALCFAVSLPIVVLEATTTQNDLVVGFFILATAFHVFDYTKTKRIPAIALIALSCALGMMTKGTFVFYVLPFGAYLFVSMLKRPVNWKVLASLIVGTLALTLLLNVPFWYKTWQIFDSPIGNMSNGNKTHLSGFGDYVSVVSKHVFLHLGFVSPGNQYNIFLENVLNRLHNAMDVPLNAPGTGMPFKMNKLNFNEDFAHNFFAMWFILLSIPLLFVARLSKPVKWYAALAFLSFLIFCFFIGYQIYGSRLHIAFFLLASPAIGMVYGAVLSTFFARLFGVFLWLCALPFALLSVTHPLLSTKWFFESVFPPINSALHLNIQIDSTNNNLKQESILWASPEEIIWGEYWSELQELQKQVNALHPKTIGFNFTEASYDYAYQYILREPGRIFEHVLVENPSKKLEKPTFRPDVIVSELGEGKEFVYHGQHYKLHWSKDSKWIYIPSH